jgi:16S rRNA (cytosine1402-N4)-methyltransferase
MSSQHHRSVLLNEVLSSFEGADLRVFVDGTLGAGGHAEALLNGHPEVEKFIGIDQDPAALSIAEKRLLPWKSKIILKQGNFSNLSMFLDQLKVAEVDGILLDLGVSSMQLDMPEKGFSFMHEGPLDMRMDPKNPISAQEVVNTWEEQELGKIFREYGEEKQWRLAARTIVNARQNRPLQTTHDLVNLLYPVLHKKSKKGLHPLTLIFQALRICVNAELEVLEEILPRAIERLKSGGRLAVISFHSLEDRIVKNLFRYEASDKEDTTGLAGLFLSKRPTVKILTKKPVIPEEKESNLNPRSRSAKLRLIEKL